MELEELENINKNDFLPLVDKMNIKQELNDPANGGVSTETGAGATNIGSCNNIGSEENSESSNLLCDSAEKQVRKIQ